MTDEIGLRELLDEVKRELLTQSMDDVGPLLYVEGVELELCFTASRKGEAGVRLYIVDVGGSTDSEQAQKVRVSLRPLFTREELRSLLEQDSSWGPKLQQVAVMGTMKGGVFDE